MLREYPNANPHYLRKVWETELDVEIGEDMWFGRMQTLSICNKAKAVQLKILHRAHISPSRRSKFKDGFSPMCSKCKIEIGCLTHCL